MNTFTEVQQNPYRWILAIAPVTIWIATGCVLFYALNDTGSLIGDDTWFFIMTFVGYMMFSFFAFGIGTVILFRKISTSIDAQSVRFCIEPFGQWQIIEYPNIERIYFREFALIGEYPQGNYGIRQGPNGWAYTISVADKYGLQIVKKSGGKILISTKKPDELRAFLNTLPVSTTA